MIEYHIDTLAFRSAEMVGITPYGIYSKKPGMPVIEFANDWAICPSLYTRIKKRLIVPYEVPSLRIIGQLLQLPSRHSAAFPKDIFGHVYYVCHGCLLFKIKIQK
ncbi:hypothetical protein AJ88_26075 [Mesorhizobium amorphae CCBAU 01583]|nr:hypothetical protein AJ88_26075 [Mesorhizobium amorphae CCBAU 01583]